MSSRTAWVDTARATWPRSSRRKRSASSSSRRRTTTWPFHFDTNLSEEENRLLTGIRVANRQIFERSSRSREYHGMGTTVVGAMFSPRKGRMYIGHVGDSRCYRVRGGAIQQLTRDHSLINDYLLAMPDLTEEQRSELPKNVITRALGMQDQVVVDLQHDDPRPGDVYVLCSDGLSGMVTDEEILKVVTASADIREACAQLIARANDHGGEDNVTAVLIKIEEHPDAPTEEIQSLKTKSVPAAATAATAPPDAASPAPAPVKGPLPDAVEDDDGMSDEPTSPGLTPQPRGSKPPTS
jgi:serine/threonine protein phosphatase PrpC